MSRYLSLLLVFICLPALAKDPEIYRDRQGMYGAGGGSIYLFKNGDYRYYSSSGGCIDPILYDNWGKWSKKKDTIIFHPLSHHDLVGIDTVIATGAPSDTIEVTVLDNNGENVSCDVGMSWHVKRSGYYPTDGWRKSKTDNSSVLMRITRPGAFLSVRSVENYVGAVHDIDVSKASRFVVKLGLNKENINRYFRAVYRDSGPGKLIMAGDTLHQGVSSPFATRYIRETAEHR